VIRHLGRRLAWAVFVVWAVVTLTFVVNNVIPSDPARMVAGAQARPRDVDRIRTQLGLDQPLVVQYGRFMRRLVHFGPGSVDPKDPEHGSCSTFGFVHLDFGKSYQQHRPVGAILGERLPRTLFLALAALLVQVVVGVSLGWFAAAKRGRFWDHAAVGGSLLGISAPTFIVGLLLQFVFAHKLRLLPLDGFGKTTGEHLVSVILPALTLGISGAAYYTRLVRDELINLIKQDYVRTAKAKGVGPMGLWLKHALRNALVPLITVVGLDLGFLVGGAIVTETLFRWPGLGALSVASLLDRDGPVILATVIVTSTAIVLSNVAVDASYALLDPRVRKP
jgi:peptide/nickel transport system permease protein